MAIIHAYFDDSSDDKRARYVAVGGLIGNETQFLDLDILWSSRTKKLAEPFRSTECETRHGQFGDWDKRDCDLLMKDLVGIIKRVGFIVFGSIIPVREFRECFPLRDEHGPYLLALRHTIISMARAARDTSKTHMANEIRITCEDSETTSSKALQVYSELKRFEAWSLGQYLAGFSVGTKKVMALQAADLLAREAFKHADNFGIRPSRKPVRRLRNDISFHLWTKETLECYRAKNGQNVTVQVPA